MNLTPRKWHKLKIAHLTSVHGLFDTRIFHKQCRSLESAGYEVHLVVSTAKDAEVDKVFIHAVSQSGGRIKRMLLTGLRVYRKALQIDAAIYHIHDPELIPFGLLLKRRGKIVIFDSHEDYPADIFSKRWIPRHIRGCVSRMFSILERYAYPKLDALVVVHQELAKRISSLQPNTVIVHNFPLVDSDFTPRPVRNQKFVWLGMLNKIRGSDQIDAAVLGFSNITLDIIGSTGGLKFKADNINTLGSFEHAIAMDMAGHYLAGLVTYLPEPNHIDALPNKLFEYMALGLPVIASDFPKWRRIVDDAACGILVDPMDPAQIRAAMDWMYQNPQLAMEMGLRGREAVLGKYSWASEEKVLLGLYKELS